MHKWEGGAWKQVKEAQMKRTEWTFGRTLKRKGTGTSISLPTKYRTLLNTPYLQPLLAPFSRCYHSCRWSNALKGLRLENCTFKIQPGISGTRVLSLDPERAVRLQKACQAEPWEQSCCPATGQTQPGTGSAPPDAEGKTFCIVSERRNLGWRFKASRKTNTSYLGSSLGFCQTPSLSPEVSSCMVPGGGLRQCSSAL